jgi:uncharacterized integral membrane protein (TIGR00698 family)
MVSAIHLSSPAYKESMKVNDSGHLRRMLKNVSPGLALCCAVAALITAISAQIPKTILDPLLIALMFGIVVKNIFPQAKWHLGGTRFSGKTILELSVMLMGASIFLPDVASAGLGLFTLILFGVTGSMLIAFVIGHVVLKLSPRMAILIGVSNSICGNSAAAVMAPIIGASSMELSSVIAISGLLGATQIVILPILVPAFGLSDYHYGIVAGMAVYAVAQVYAASATVSATSASVATFVKLVRVVLLLPLVVVIQLLITLKNYSSQDNSNVKTPKEFKSTAIQQYVPWFVIGFIALAILRSFELIGEAEGNQIRGLARYSFLVSMFAIGLSVNIRDILKVGPKILVVISCTVLFMITISILGGSLILSS